MLVKWPDGPSLNALSTLHLAQPYAKGASAVFAEELDARGFERKPNRNASC